MKESGSDDASDLDATGMDAAIDSGLADSTVSSTDGAVDAATDSTSVDSSAGDTSVADSASVDSSVSDSAVADSSSTEAAVPDAGDAGRSIVYASGVVVSTLAGNGIYGRFFHAMLRRGVALAPGPYEVMFPGLAHDEAVLARVVEAAGEAAAEVAR